MHQTNTVPGTFAVVADGALLNKVETAGLEAKKEIGENKSRRTKRNKFVCPYCGLETVLIWVHGHYQCGRCKTVIESCCESY